MADLLRLTLHRLSGDKVQISIDKTANGRDLIRMAKRHLNITQDQELRLVNDEKKAVDISRSLEEQGILDSTCLTAVQVYTGHRNDVREPRPNRWDQPERTPTESDHDEFWELRGGILEHVLPGENTGSIALDNPKHHKDFLRELRKLLHKFHPGHAKSAEHLDANCAKLDANTAIQRIKQCFDPWCQDADDTDDPDVCGQLGRRKFLTAAQNAFDLMISCPALMEPIKNTLEEENAKLQQATREQRAAQEAEQRLCGQEKELEAKLQQAAREHEKVVAQLQEAEQRLRRREEELEAKLQQAAQEHEKVAAQLQEAEQRLRRREKELEAKLQQAAQEHEKVAAQLQEAEQRLRGRERELEAKLQQAAEEHEKVVAELQEEAKEQEAKLAQEQWAAQEAAQQYETDVAQLREKVVTAEGLLTKGEAVLLALKPGGADVAQLRDCLNQQLDKLLTQLAACSQSKDKGQPTEVFDFRCAECSRLEEETYVQECDLFHMRLSRYSPTITEVLKKKFLPQPLGNASDTTSDNQPSITTNDMQPFILVEVEGELLTVDPAMAKRRNLLRSDVVVEKQRKQDVEEVLKTLSFEMRPGVRETKNWRRCCLKALVEKTGEYDSSALQEKASKESNKKSKEKASKDATMKQSGLLEQVSEKANAIKLLWHQLEEKRQEHELQEVTEKDLQKVHTYKSSPAFIAIKVVTDDTLGAAASASGKQTIRPPPGLEQEA